MIFNGIDYENISPATETIARRLCQELGIDPDKETVGLGKSMPEGYHYPLWKAQVFTIETVSGAIIEAIEAIEVAKKGV